MQYGVRVEIHNQMYDRLHTAMEAESLSRILTADGSGKKSKLPIGMYWMDSHGDAWTVLEAAKRAALSVDASAEIAVFGGPQIVYYNCPDAVPEHPLAAMLRLGLATPAQAPALSLFAKPSETRFPLTSLLSAPAPSASESAIWKALSGTTFKG